MKPLSAAGQISDTVRVTTITISLYVPTRSPVNLSEVSWYIVNLQGFLYKFSTHDTVLSKLDMGEGGGCSMAVSMTNAKGNKDE